MKRYFAIFSSFFKISFINLTIYRGDIFFRNLGYAIESGILILFFNVLYLQITEINGWQFSDLLLILAAYNLLDWLLYFFYEHNHRDLHVKVNKGELDLILTKPVDTQFIVSFSRVDLQSFSGLIIGGGLILYVLRSAFYPERLALYLLLFLIGVIIHYCVSLIIASISFFSPQMEDFKLIEGRFRDLVFYPIDIYPPLLRFIFKSVLPIAFFTTIPAMSFSRLEPMIFIQAIFTMGVFVFLSRKFFLFGLRRYSSASS